MFGTEGALASDFDLPAKNGTVPARHSRRMCLSVILLNDMLAEYHGQAQLRSQAALKRVKERVTSIRCVRMSVITQNPRRAAASFT